MKKVLDICVLSDMHLGTHGCRAEELLDYLQHIEPARLILNGDIIDAWQFKKKYFPASHWEVIERISRNGQFRDYRLLSNRQPR